MKDNLKKALIVYNPVAGWMPSKSLLFDLIQNLSKNNVVSEIYMTKKNRSTANAMAELADGCDFIICCGGDGTLHEVINGISRNNIDLPLGYIPIGTTNDFAKSHNIPHDFNNALKLIKKKNIQPLDVGVLNGKQYFSYIACFGVFTKLTYDASQSLKNSLGSLAYFLEGTKELPDLFKSYPMEIIADGEKIDGDFTFGAVVNSMSVGGIFKLPVTNSELNDGQFEILLVKLPENWPDVQNVAGNLLTGRYEHEKILFLKAKEVTFISKEPIAWNEDGEFAGNYKKVTIQVKSQGIKFFL